MFKKFPRQLIANKLEAQKLEVIQLLQEQKKRKSMNDSKSVIQDELNRSASILSSTRKGQNLRGVSAATEPMVRVIKPNQHGEFLSGQQSETNSNYGIGLGVSAPEIIASSRSQSVAASAVTIKTKGNNNINKIKADHKTPVVKVVPFTQPNLNLTLNEMPLPNATNYSMARSQRSDSCSKPVSEMNLNFEKEKSGSVKPNLSHVPNANAQTMLPNLPQMPVVKDASGNVIPPPPMFPGMVPGMPPFMLPPHQPGMGPIPLPPPHMMPPALFHHFMQQVHQNSAQQGLLPQSQQPPQQEVSVPVAVPQTQEAVAVAAPTPKEETQKPQSQRAPPSHLTNKQNVEVQKIEEKLPLSKSDTPESQASFVLKPDDSGTKTPLRLASVRESARSNINIQSVQQSERSNANAPSHFRIQNEIALSNLNIQRENNLGINSGKQSRGRSSERASQHGGKGSSVVRRELRPVSSPPSNEQLPHVEQPNSNRLLEAFGKGLKNKVEHQSERNHLAMDAFSQALAAKLENVNNNQSPPIRGMQNASQPSISRQSSSRGKGLTAPCSGPELSAPPQLGSATPRYICSTKEKN